MRQFTRAQALSLRVISYDCTDAPTDSTPFLTTTLREWLLLRLDLYDSFPLFYYTNLNGNSIGHDCYVTDRDDRVLI